MTSKSKIITPNEIPQFVNWLRSVAPYIHLFKEKIFVYLNFDEKFILVIIFLSLYFLNLKLLKK